MKLLTTVWLPKPIPSATAPPATAKAVRGNQSGVEEEGLEGRRHPDIEAEAAQDTPAQQASQMLRKQPAQGEDEQGCHHLAHGDGAIFGGRELVAPNAA
jgi:hypothetical protein